MSPKNVKKTRALGPKRGGEREDPRLAQTRDIVLSSAVNLLLREGLGGVTAARVHQSTGVARTTIYRHWPTQTDLVLSTLDRLTVPGHILDVTDDFEADLRELLKRLKKRMAKRRVRELASATLALAMESPDHARLARKFLDGLLRPIRERISIETAHAEMDARQAERLYDRVVAPFVFRHVMMLGAIQQEQIDDVVRHAVAELSGRTGRKP